MFEHYFEQKHDKESGFRSSVESEPTIELKL